MLTFTWIQQINRCHILNATWTTSLTCVEVAGFVRTLLVRVHSAHRLGCLRLKVPNIVKFFVNRFYFVVIFCVQRIACRTKFMHLFGNLWVWDAGHAGRWIIGGYAIGVLQLLPKVACWPFAWAFDNSSFISWWVTRNPPHLHWADGLSWC